MNTQKWLNRNTKKLSGKTVVITGATGGIGKELCRYFAILNANLILLNRNAKKTAALCVELRKEFPLLDCKAFTVDFEDIQSVEAVCKELESLNLDYLILNAAAYSIPRKTTSCGFDNVFQINFLSPFYMVKRLMPSLRKFSTKVVLVGSIAHNYSKTDQDCVDFSNRKSSALVYGNSKRYIMASLYKLFENEKGTSLSICHPGITFTNITAHYPKLIFAIIKYPMKVIFMKPKKAALCILKGCFENADGFEWIGPRLFGIWGLPKKTPLKSISTTETDMIFDNAEKIYNDFIHQIQSI